MNSKHHHYIPQFYLRMFSCNPKASKSKQEIHCLTTGKDIYRKRIKKVCTFPAFNTQDQENIQSAIENELAPPLRDLVDSQIIKDNSEYIVRKLASLLIAGTFRFRAIFSEMEDALLSLGDDFEKYFTKEYRIQGRLEHTLLCAEKIHEELENNYPTMLLLTSKTESFITSDNPVVFHAKEGSQEDYIIDFADIAPTPIFDKNIEKDNYLILSYKIKRIRIPASVLYVPLSSRTLLMLIDNNKLRYGPVFDQLMVSGHEVNHLNKHVFGRCMERVFASSESLLQQCKGIIRQEGVGIITTYANS